MYNELYLAWKQEVEKDELGKLSSSFYSDLANYLKKLREESRMLDKRTAKASLLKKETQNVKRMAVELIETRYRKLIRVVSKGEEPPAEGLTSEEEKLLSGVTPVTETYHSFAKNVLHGNSLIVDAEQGNKRIVLRFLKDIPAIMGADMKPYGPFKVEDIASLPRENAKILVKQGLAEKITNS